MMESMIGSQSSISQHTWGTFAGTEVYLFRLVNAGGAYVELSNYGATLVSVVVPDKQGVPGNVVLGFPTLQGYLDDTCYIGATIGRFANRIAGATFRLDDTIYHLQNNDGENSNHGAGSGFNFRVFDHEIADNSLIFTLLSEDGDGGYPGNLELKVTYRWTDSNELVISYSAISDKNTIANFTNHAYFNLSQNGENIGEHILTINANNVLEADAAYIPTGNIKPAGKIAFNNTPVKDNISIQDGKLTGLNDCYVLNTTDDQPEPAAVLYEKNSGRTLEVFTTYPGLMLYTADYLESKHAGHGGKMYEPFGALCLECQYFPDSPNHPSFPSTVLNAGDTYDETIIYRFGIMV